MPGQRRTHKLRDGSVGLLLGAATGALIGFVTNREEPAPPCTAQSLFCGGWHGVREAAAATIGAAVGGLGGTIAGVYFGSRPRESWTTYQDHIVPVKGSMLGLSLRF